MAEFEVILQACRRHHQDRCPCHQTPLLQEHWCGCPALQIKSTLNTLPSLHRGMVQFLLEYRVINKIISVIGLLTNIGLNDFHNVHSHFETNVDGFDEDGKDEI